MAVEAEGTNARTTVAAGPRLPEATESNICACKRMVVATRTEGLIKAEPGWDNRVPTQHLTLDTARGGGGCREL